MPVTTNTREWPIVLMTYSGDVTLADTELALKEIEALNRRAERDGKYGIVSDGRTANGMDARARRLVGDWMKANAEWSRRVSVGNAIVNANTVQRGILTAILWLAETPTPIKAFSSIEEGKMWLRSLPGFPIERSPPGHAR